MKNLFREYIELSDGEKSDLWDEAVFIFDTNVFLNLYRYTKKTRDDLLRAFEALSPRIWMPYNVADEYLKNRCSVLLETKIKYDNLEEDINKQCKEWKEALYVTDEESEFDQYQKNILEWLGNMKNRNLSNVGVDEDEILKTVCEIFENKIGAAYEEKDRKKLEADGEERYKNNMPPGYKDRKKQDNPYGDYLIWMQILDFAKKNRKDIIFVSDDKKEDWWNQVKGQKVGPRYELRKEFYNKTDRKFHMYTMKRFLEMHLSNDKSLSEDTVREVNNFVIEQINKKDKKVKINDLQNELDNIEMQISHIENDLEFMEDLSVRDDFETEKEDDEFYEELCEMRDYYIWLLKKRSHLMESIKKIV